MNKCSYISLEVKSGMAKKEKAKAAKAETKAAKKKEKKEVAGK